MDSISGSSSNTIIPDFGLGTGSTFGATSEPFQCTPSLLSTWHPPRLSGVLPTLLDLSSSGSETSHFSKEPGSFGGWGVDTEPGALAVLLAAGQPIPAADAGTGVCGP